MQNAQIRRQARLKRKMRIRKKVTGSMAKPRLCVFRSAKHVYAQLIDDVAGATLIAASSLDKEIKARTDFKNKIEKAVHIGQLIAERALEKGISNIVFDRNGFLYHGRVKAVSDGARKGGLNF